MELGTFKKVIEELNRRRVRYLLAGGMAVVAHGYGRMTFDIDLWIDLEPGNILSFFSALDELGYTPRAPVTAEQFADQSSRRKLIRDKGMTVLNFVSEQHTATPIDVFAEPPFKFEEAFEKSPSADVEGAPFHYVDIQTLIEMKEKAGRPVDIEDVRHLRIIADDRA